MAGIIGAAVLVSLLMFLSGPDPAMIGWVLMIVFMTAIVICPRWGVYLILFLTLVGDTSLIPWFPFAKNLSSAESLLFLHDSLIFSPLELFLVLTLVAWLLRDTFQRKLHIFTGRLFWPALIFLFFVVFGLLYGYRTGGSLVIGLWEARPLFYLVLMLFLASNLIKTRAHVSNLVWAAVLGLIVPGLFGNYAFFVVLNSSLAGIESLSDHATAIHWNTLFILILAVWLYKTSLTKRLVLPAVALLLVIPYLATQRRAAFISLVVALGLFLLLLWWENRRLFLVIAPAILVVGAAYLAIFWNHHGALGQPAQAIKSVIAPDAASLEDQSSNIYRVLENINISYTIHQKPLTGIGFGQTFYIIIPMADISFFDWWQYYTHNSIMWIWLKMGFGGFLTMLFLVGSTLMLGGENILRVPRGELRAIAIFAALYMVMHFLFAYVDISWDSRSMVFVGAMMGVINSLQHIASQPEPSTDNHFPSRWPWLSNTIASKGQ